MQPTFKFRQGTMLWAQNSEVIWEMWDLFKADVREFYDAIGDAVETILNDEKLEIEKSDAYRSWNIEDTIERNHGDVPYVWAHHKEAVDVAANKLTFHIDYEGKDADTAAKVAMLKGTLRLPGNCKIEVEKKYFSLTVTYSNENPVDDCASPLAIVLRALDAAAR